MEEQKINIQVLCHSSIKITGEKTIYIDPFKINAQYQDSDIIFITHDHYDHYSLEDIQKIIQPHTILVCPETMQNQIQDLQLKPENILTITPNETYQVSNIKIETIPAYNINKPFHPKANNWVGYIITINNKRYYIAGDTDITEENQKVKCDIALLPIGGTYTMDYKEAAKLANTIKPEIVIPTHYGSIVGNKEDAIKFKELIEPTTKCDILIK